ncbi:hypothetical protein, partial [Sediminicola luteus]
MKYRKGSDRAKLKALNGLLSPRPVKGEGGPQEVTFRVQDNGELRYIISCLLRVSIAALEQEGNSMSPRLPYLSNETAVVAILELINDILP